MLGRYFIFLFIFALSSCSSFKTQSLSGKKLEELLQSLRATGEGRGRLSIPPQQYVFSYDAVLNEKFDWILAVSIPLHGEEILSLPNLRLNESEELSQEALTIRMKEGISQYLSSQKETKISADKFLQELRCLMQIILHRELDKKLSCEAMGQDQVCRLDDVIYHVQLDNKKLLLKKQISPEHQIELVAENLTGSIFTKTSIFFRSQKGRSTSSNILSLELFWK